MSIDTLALHGRKYSSPRQPTVDPERWPVWPYKVIEIDLRGPRTELRERAKALRDAALGSASKRKRLARREHAGLGRVWSKAMRTDKDFS